MNQKELQYLFCKPKFPLIISIEDYFIGAKTPADLLRKLPQAPVGNKEYYQAIDKTGKGWSFSPGQMLLSPLALKKDGPKNKLFHCLIKEQIRRMDSRSSILKNHFPVNALIGLLRIWSNYQKIFNKVI